MKRKVSRLRLSPNEEARIIREELERRRKLRIQQVREQQREISLRIRREVERRRQQELQQLEEQLREEWERRQREELRALQSSYQESLRLVGQSHRRAKENEPDLAAAAQREEEGHAKAEERYREALKELKTQRITEEERQKRAINARKKALQTEKERSAKVASLPPPPPDPIQELDPKKPHVVKRSDLNAFAATRYHMAESAVEKELDAAQPDAREEADLEARRLQELQREDQRRREEQLETARLRGRRALRREQLVQDRERLLNQLEHMQQTDLLRRRQQVSQMPPQIFQPLHKRQEAREDFQREMEFAFEDMYTGERRVKGDLVVQLVPEPLPALSTAGQDQELDVTLDENGEPEAESLQGEVEAGVGSSEPETEAAAGALRPPPRRALRKLLDRIRSQRDDWISGSGRVPAGDLPTVFTDLIPERDTTIETGSLTPVALHESTVPPPAVEPTEPPPAAELPAVFLSRIQELEEERQKREAEMEMEKRQQMVLLQELEEQKAKLEQMLQEARQERDQLKAAVTQEEQPPVQDQIPMGSASAAEEESTRRLREYQRRLLDQNRIHRRSVEVARQRLEEHQRALRIRHNMAAIFLRPPAPVQVPTTPPDDPNEPKAASSSGGVGSDQSVLNTIGTQRPDVTAQLTNSVLEKVTRHLPERLRPPSAHGSTSRTSDPIRAAGPDVPQLDGRRRELEALQQMRSQKEALQALIDADQREAAGAPAEGPEDVGQNRLKLLASLLRAIEESNGGSLSHLEEPEERDDFLQPEHGGRAPLVPSAVPPEPSRLFLHPPPEPSRLLLHPPPEPSRLLLHPPPEPSRLLLHPPPEPSRLLLHPPPEPSRLLLHPPPAPRPPVTRVRLGFREMMPEQHELSAIQEVETPANVSRATGPEDDVPPRPADVNLQDASGWLETPDWTLQSPSVSSGGPDSAERRAGSEASSHLPWRERLLSGAGTSPERSECDSAVAATSALGSHPGSGADSPGPAVLSSRSPSEPPRRPPDPDCHSSTTISSGSYVSTEPEQNVNAADDPRPSRPTGSSLGAVSPPGPQDLGLKENSASVRPGLSVDSVFSDSSIQRIIDRYTRELDISLGAAGTTTDSEGPSLEESSSSVSQQPLGGSPRTEDEASAGRHGILEMTSPGHPSVERFSPGDQSLNVDPEQDSFRPLRFQLTDQSSCLAPGDGHSVLEQLVGQPSAHSSMIGPRLGPAASLGSDPGGWDSALSRMIGRLSQQPGSRWLSPVLDSFPGRTRSEPWWLYESQEESRMRPLVGELDDSVDPHSASSGVTETRRPCPGEGSPAAHGASHESSAASGPALLPEASDRASSVPHGAGLVELDSHRAEDSFHPLLPEITHNETADPSATFQPPEHPSASGGASPSPERLRGEEPSRCGPLQESFSQLVISLSSSDAGTSDDLLPLREGRDENQEEPTSEAGGERGILEQSQITLVSLTDTTLQDPITTDDEGLQENMAEDGQEAAETQGAEETPGRPPFCPASVLEIQWTPSGDLRDAFQRKRQALIQRSKRRVQDIKAKRCGGSSEAESRVLERREPVRSDRVPSVTCKEETTAAWQRETDEGKLLPPGHVSGSGLKPISGPEQRRRSLTEMHKRTQRLYEQLEEVKQQRAARGRQEDGAKNRLKAKEFHRKTLQKLRAQQTRR